MRRKSTTGAGTGRPRRGFSLLEVTLSTLIVGVMLTAALRTLATTSRMSVGMTEECRARLWAHELMAEILRQKYKEPAETLAFGPEASEGTVTRALFDDVDDYHNWTASPPKFKDGTDMPAATGWRHSVTVAWVDPANVATTVGTDQKVKKVVVSIAAGNRVLATLEGLRTDSDL